MAVTTTTTPGAPSPGTGPSELVATWYIARRAALESLRDRTTLITSLFFALILPTFLVLLVVRPQATHALDAAKKAELGATLAVYLLVVGLMPSSGSISIAAGVFAGEKEQGNLAPLLATPISNAAIFGGKVLGAVLPALTYAVLAELTYLSEVAVFIGPTTMRLLPVALSLAMVALVPPVAVLGAAIASLISSRVRTYNSAQILASLVLLPIMGALFGLVFALQHWGPWALVVTVAALVGLDALVILLSAATWRREEVMAQR